MQKNALRSFAALLILVMAVSFPGCKYESGSSGPNDQPVSLWVITEETISNGMNQQARALIEQFTSTYPDVSIQLEILPTEEEERAARLDQLYTLIDEGNGPDIYLLPTRDVLTLEHPTKYTYKRISPLFPDVNIAMRKGIFQDINQWYKKDRRLNKDALCETVMEAGMVDGARYALPLRYNVPVMYICEDYFQEKGIDTDIFRSGIGAWMEYVIEKADPVLACGAEFISTQAFTDLIDYHSNEVILTQETAKRYLQLSQSVQALIGSEIGHRSATDILSYIFGNWTPFPAQAGLLNSALGYTAVAKAESQELAIYPLSTMEGDSIATVEYYAAVGANCDAPALAYEFIRLFLLEESQWEQNRLNPEDEPLWGLAERGWPVRTKGSVAPLWKNYQKASIGNFSGDDQTPERQKNILSLELTDSDIPVLETEIDFARFPAYLSPPISTITARMSDQENGSTPMDVDLDALADELISNLQSSIR